MMETLIDRSVRAFAALILVAWPFSPAIAGDMKVFASNYPLAFFAEQISGRTDAVQFPQIDGDPAFWRPSAADVLAMQKADVILLNGAGYEKWLTSVSLPKSRTVDTAAGFANRHLVNAAAVKHTHGSGVEHAHGGTAFTTWIDFTQAIEQAEAVRDALLAAGIASTTEVNQGFESLRADLLRLDRALVEATRNLADTPVIASHPVYQYMARRYDIDLESVHWEPDVFPSPEMWTELEAVRRTHPARWMIWESRPLAKTVDRLEALGVRSIVFNPAGNRPESGNFITVMEANVEDIAKISGSGT